MSTQPTPIRPTREQVEQQRTKASRFTDALYFAGAGLVTLGASLFSVRVGLMVAGSFCLLIPMTGIIQSFVRGLRAGSPRR